MITKRQWNRFIRDLRRVVDEARHSRRMSERVFMKGEEILRVDQGTVYCVPKNVAGMNRSELELVESGKYLFKAGAQTIYKHPQSLKDETTLKQLYNTIEIKIEDTLSNRSKYI